MELAKENKLAAFKELQPKLNPLQAKVFEGIRRHRLITREELANQLGMKLTTVQARVVELRDDFVLIKEAESKANLKSGNNNTLLEPYRDVEERKQAIIRRWNELRRRKEKLEENYIDNKEKFNFEQRALLDRTIAKLKRQIEKVSKL